MSDSTRHRKFWDVVCGFEGYLFHLFVAVLVMLLLLGFSALLVDPSSAAFVVVQVDAIVLGSGAVAILYSLYRCQQR